MRSFPILLATVAATIAAEPPEPRFTHYTLDPKIQIGYGLAIADVDGDRRLDALLADKRQIVWYQNPGTPPAGAATLVAPIWSKFILAENLTEKDNVCIAAQDIDGDGKCEVAVGAEWNPADTEKSGAVFYLIPPADRTQRWTPVKFPSVEPTTHRMRWIRLVGEPVAAVYDRRTSKDERGEAAGAAPSKDGDAHRAPLQRWGLVVCPLHGRGNKNGEGAPVKVLLYRPPTPLPGAAEAGGNRTLDPVAGAVPADAGMPPGWTSEVIDESMHMTHNFELSAEGSSSLLLLGGREGVKSLVPSGGRWKGVAVLGQGVTTLDAARGGVGEVRHGKLGKTGRLVAFVEPMHGHRLGVMTSVTDPGAEFFSLQVKAHYLTDKLTEGHALATGDLLKTGGDQIVVGWRGTPGKAGSTTGVAMWTPLDEKGEKWRETMIDPDGMACEDLQLADLDADGDLDIVAAGRATKNVKIYWNETPR